MIQAGAIRHRVSRRAAGQLAAVMAVAIVAGIAAGAGAHLLLAGGARIDGLPATAAATTGRCAARPRGPRGPARLRRSLRCATRPAAASASAPCAGARVAIEFFDSHCKSACPLAGRALAASERALPAAQRPVLVVVSVNPQDTRASVRAAIRSWGLAGLAPWHWLMGTHAQLAPVWAAYHIFVAADPR